MPKPDPMTLDQCANAIEAAQVLTAWKITLARNLRDHKHIDLQLLEDLRHEAARVVKACDRIKVLAAIVSEGISTS